MRRNILSIGLLTAVAALPLQVSGTSNRADISASVSEVCRFSAPQLTLQNDGKRAFGQAIEACNSRGGYSVVAITRELQASERVVLRYDSNEYNLGSTGSTVLFRRNGPSFKIVDMQLEANALAEPIALTFAVSAL